MFEIAKTVKFLTLISYIGFIISSLSGFVIISNKLNISVMMSSIIVLLNMVVFMFLDITNKLEDYINRTFYLRAYILIMVSLIVMGISPIGIAFGIYGLIIGFMNIFMGVFYIDSTQININNTQININNTQNLDTV